MNSVAHQKVRTTHLNRCAFLYIRQSTLRQVFENTESTKRQYALRQQAVALGWPAEKIIVIDSDLGHSGASAADRAGFQKLVAEVGMGHAGIVLGLEVSRLARSSTDWHRLLEICGLTDTLILDEDGIYNPNDFNDRLLLGLKGTMSEAELHILQARMRGGILNKARRGELKVPLPIGFIYDEQNQVVLDPDQQVQKTLHLFFQTFYRVGSAFLTVKAFKEQGLRFPQRLHKGMRKGELLWVELTHTRALQILHNPRYAGAFFYGKTQVRHNVNGGKSHNKLSNEDWHALIQDAHERYISWEEFEGNLRRLRENAQAHGIDRRKSPPREGCALLQGLVICGICGKRMTVRYHQRGARIVPDYVCQREGIKQADKICQSIPGVTIDEAIGELLLEVVKPLALEVTLAVQDELNNRAAEVENLHQQQVERIRYETELAKRRYMRVDPDNRLVANELEAIWNTKLRELAEAQEAYERQRQSIPDMVDEKQHSEILSIARDFPELWRNAGVHDRERKRMLRLIVEDVTLQKKEQIIAHVRFKGGAARTLTLPVPLCSWESRKTDDLVVQEINRLIEHHTDAEIAGILNERGLRSGTGKPFTAIIIKTTRRKYGLKDRFTRLRETGLLTLKEMAIELKVSTSTIKLWQKHDLLHGHNLNDRGEYLYEHPGGNPPQKHMGKKLSQNSCNR